MIIASPREYLHGTEPQEQKRLSRLNDILNGASLSAIRLRGGERILDVGCGMAQFTRAMGREAGARVMGIDQSEAQLREARSLARQAAEEHLIDLRQGEAASLPLRGDEWGAFDVAHARFLLEHVPHPEAVVNGMVRALRAGGRIVLEDDDHGVIRLWPEPPGFGALWNAYIGVYERLGYDPYVGRKLVSLLHQAGAVPARNTWLFFGSCAGNESLGPLVDNTLGLLEGARERIVEWQLLAPAAFDRAVSALREWKERPDAAMWFATAWAEGVRAAPVEGV
ncbi:MAG: class I SAM-dependent methyltransferase [Terriglobia bacterium]